MSLRWAPARRSTSAGLRFRLASGHPDAEFLGRCVGGVFAGDLALVQRDDPVGQFVDLFELGGDQQHRSPVTFLFEDLLPYEFDRADVEAPRRLRGDEELRVVLELARKDEFLLVPA